MSELDLSTPYATWVYLNRVVEGPSAALQALLTQYPAEEIAHGIYHRAEWIGPLLARRIWQQQNALGLGSSRQKAQNGQRRSLIPHSAFIKTAGKPQLPLMTKHCRRTASGCVAPL